MKSVRYLVALAVVVSFVKGGFAQSHAGHLGLGVMLGDVTGPTMKYFMSDTTALDAGLGFSSDMDAYADIVWHDWRLFPRPARGYFGGYLSVGPRYEEQEHRDDKFGIRTMAGVNYWISEVPFEVFFEVGPWFVFSPDTDTEIDAGIGLRYFFGSGPRHG